MAVTNATIAARLDEIAKDVSEIKAQVTATNGRVKTLELWKARLEGAVVFLPAVAIAGFTALVSALAVHFIH